MRVKPILFNTDMVRAILDGRKTVTRRVVKPSLGDSCPNCGQIHSKFIYQKITQNLYCERCGFPHKVPYHPGDVLYVRETWQHIDFAGEENGYVYKASQNGEIWEQETEGWYWRPSIHMPKEAARIWLKVTDVRVERLHEIRNFREEGIKVSKGCDEEVELFADLWDSTVKKESLDRYSWVADPWVWVIEFKRCEIRNLGEV